MQILILIAVVCFVALAGAALAIARHVRRTAPAPALAAVSSKAVGPGLTPALLPSPTRVPRYQTKQRHDHTYSSANDGNLADPGARAHTRPMRQKPKQ